MNPDSYTTFELEVRNDVAYATLNSSDDLHRLPTLELNRELARLGFELRTSNDIRALVLTGRGEIFSLGNLGGAAAHEPDALGPNLSKNTVRTFIREFLDLDIPVITALNGPVMGAILAFVLLSDIIIAEEHVTLQDMHVSTGRPSTTGPYLWPPTVGLMQARKYLLTGDRLTAQEAERIGLVTEVVAKGTSLSRAEHFADRFRGLSPTAVGGTKRALNQWLKIAFPTVFDASVAIQFLAMAQPDYHPAALDALQHREYRHLSGDTEPSDP